MKFLFLLIVLLSAGVSVVSAGSDIVACTTDYAPICGSVQVQCITAPCNPVRQTFGNACMANASHATNIMTGACDGTPVTPPIVGGDSDSHGCRASAGYSWESRVGQCLRPWESRVRVVNIAPVLSPCVFGMLQTECLQTRFAGWHQPWSSIYGGITGFDHSSGSSYRLLVLETHVENPPADGSAISYSLIKILSQTPTISTENPLIGKWTLMQFNITKIENQNYTLTFEQNRLSAKFCNSTFGSYTISGNTISSPGLASTMMYCEGQPMTLENAFSLDGASYSLVALRLMEGSTGPTMHLVITTKK